MERRPQRRVRNSNTRSQSEDRRNHSAAGFSSFEAGSQKVRQVFLDADGHRIPSDAAARNVEDTTGFQSPRIDQEPFGLNADADTQRFETPFFDDSSYDDDLMPEEMSYHEERMARKAQAAKGGKQRTSSRRQSRKGSSRSSSRQQSSRQISRASESRQSESRRRPSEESARASRASAYASAQASRASAESTRASAYGSRQHTSNRSDSRQQTARRSDSYQQTARRADSYQQARARDARQERLERKKLQRQETQRLDPVAVRKAAKRRSTRKKLPLIIIGAAVIAALVIALLIILGGVKEAANVKITSTETTQTITWEKREKNASYEVLQKSPEGAFAVVKTVSADSAPSATIVELNSATQYEYTVRTVKGEGDKARHTNGVSVSAYTLPAAVTDLSYWTEVKDSLTFSWSDEQFVAGYELRFGTSDDLSDAEPIRLRRSEIIVDEGTGNYTYLIENLDERTPYYFSLRSFIDDSTYSAWTDIRTARVSRPVDMRGIDVNAPMVALTFDDGPEGSDVTTRILDALAANGGHATFFQLGDRSSSYPDRIQRIVNEGHEIANHTYDHSHLGDAVTREDIVSANDAIEAAGGVRPVSFRSPGGNTTDLIRQVCAEENMALYYWSLDTRDWYTRDADSVISVIKNNISDGDIILMHNIYGSTAEAVEKILPWLKDQGYQLVTVSQLLKAKTGELPVPGTQYITATKTLD